MSSLSQDLDTYWNEFYTKGDIKAGITLLSEVAGGVILLGTLFTALTVWIPGLGIPVTSIVVTKVMQLAFKAYGDLDTNQRKQIRAVVRWVKGGVNLIDG